MSLSRRTVLKLGLGAGAVSLLDALPTGVASGQPVHPLLAPPTGKERFVAARPIPLHRVRLTGGPLKEHQDADIRYLLELEPDRMLAYYRKVAGLTPKAEPYDGWDGGGRNLTGHIAGHYLSAISAMYAATGDKRFKDRVDYMVNEFKAVQDKNGDGYVVALENGRKSFGALKNGEIKAAAFDLNGEWSPWYTLHKTFAGLRDAHRHTGNPTALAVEARFAGWAESVLKPLDDRQVARMLNTEHGGMNEVLADLSVDTGDTRWMALSRRFEHHAFTDALARHQDNLAGKHVNCQIPKLIGSASRYEHTGDATDLLTASFFWDRVAQHHSYATGGQGLDEYFGLPDQLSRRVDGRACESCCVYNMLKLTRRLFSFRPDVSYADFHERMLFNHALASFDPGGVRMSYMVPVGHAEQQEYQQMFEDFTCCMGTGMENHALHGEGIYYESPDTVWVNLFAASTAELQHGVHLTMETDFPDGEHATIRVAGRAARPFTLAIRRPGWAGDRFAIAVNGEQIVVPPIASLRPGGAGGRDLGLDDGTPPPSSFIAIERAWKAGDVVGLTMPKTLRLEPTPDDRAVAAILWGPLVLAGDLGPRREEHEHVAPPDAPALVAGDRPIEEWVIPCCHPEGSDGSASGVGGFLVKGVARRIAAPNESTGDLSLTPFYRTHARTYSVYFDVLTAPELEARVAAVAAKLARAQRLERATIAFVQPGAPADEQTFHYRTDSPSRPIVHTSERTGRGGSGWFSFELPVETSGAQSIVVTYHNDLGLPVLATFEIQADGTPIGEYAPNRSATGFWDATYPLPTSVISGKSKVTVRFVAGADSRIVPVYGIRIIRARDVDSTP